MTTHEELSPILEASAAEKAAILPALEQHVLRLLHDIRRRGRCETTWTVPDSLAEKMSALTGRTPEDLRQCSQPATTVYDGARLCERCADKRAGEQQLRDEARYAEEADRG